MGFFAGFDAGGSKTECVLADASGDVLAHGLGGPANLRSTPPEVVADSLRTALAGALDRAGLAQATFEAVCAGLAGTGRLEARQRAREILFRLTGARHLYVVGDMEVALEAAIGAGPGVVLVAGTGSIAYGRNAAGQQARAGGHGGEGDVGSAADIGRQAVQAALTAEGSGLRAAICSTLGIAGEAELKRLADGGDAASLAGLVSAVVATAKQGDVAACGVLSAAAASLSTLALEVLRALGVEERPVRVAVAGGVFAASEEVREEVARRIRDNLPQVEVARLEISPAEGAVRLAQRLWLQQRFDLPVAP